MRLEDLKEPYNRLADLRRGDFSRSALVRGAFVWSQTPEGFSFWDDVYYGNTPEIPAPSLLELDSEFVTPIISTK